MISLSILILIVATALPSFKNNIKPNIFSRITAIIFIYAGALQFNVLYIQSIGSGIGIYSGLFHVTFVSQLLEVFLLIIGSVLLIAWPLNNQLKGLYNNKEIKSDNKIGNEGEEYNVYAREYSIVALFSTLGASLLVSSGDLVSMYLSIELQSFGLYVLSTLYRDSESATSAGLKYFLLGALSSCLILLGSGLIYAFTGLTNFESIYSLISISDSNNISQGISLGLIIIIVGFLFKIAAAPLHNWSPDVYDDSPTIVTIWLTIMPKISILILLLEIQTQIGLIGGLTSISINSSGYADNILNIMNTLSELGKEPLSSLESLVWYSHIYVLKNLLLISSLLSLIIGTVVGLAQTRIKRLLAYSTISHVGFILLALAINTEQSIDSMIFYIIQYILTNLNVFLIIIALSYIINFTAISKLSELDIKKIPVNDIKYLSEFKGQFFSNPLLSLSLTICLFSMAGTPPLMGFFSKLFVLLSCIESGYYFMSIVCIIVSVVSASYYLKIIKLLHTETETETKIEKEIDSTLNNWLNINTKTNDLSDSLLSNSHSFVISSLTLSILLFFIKPSLILNSTQLLSLSLFNL